MSESKKRPGEEPEIAYLYAALGIDADGDEGIIGIHAPGGWMPLVFSKLTTLAKLLEGVQAIADQTGETVHFVRFERAVVLTEVKPRPGG